MLHGNPSVDLSFWTLPFLLRAGGMCPCCARLVLKTGAELCGCLDLYAIWCKDLGQG